MNTQLKNNSNLHKNKILVNSGNAEINLISENDTTCRICCTKIDFFDPNKEKLSCGHIFHRTCIYQWFLKLNTPLSDFYETRYCPYCRNNVDKLTYNKSETYNKFIHLPTSCIYISDKGKQCNKIRVHNKDFCKDHLYSSISIDSFKK